jgi:transcriptional repressor NrdR
MAEILAFRGRRAPLAGLVLRARFGAGERVNRHSCRAHQNGRAAQFEVEMRCPFCGHDDSQVKDSRPSEDNSAIRRRRHCPECGGRFTTFERVQLRELIVVKKNGRREAFDRDKLERSINHALRKRPVERERVDRTITGIVRRLESMGENEIPANMIGELVMQALASLDKVAYVRFASVYRNFRETRDFEALIGELEGDDKDV